MRILTLGQLAVWLAIAVAVAVACLAAPASSASPLVTGWSAGAAGACQTATFEGDSFTVCRYRAALDELRLVSRGPSGPIDSLPALKAWLGDDAERAEFAMNAGMYQPDQRPVGLMVQDGVEVQPLNTAAGEGNFFMSPNGVFWVGDDGMPHVDETSAYVARGVGPRWATQSGPLVVRAGVLHPRIADNGVSRLIRNGVGVRGGEAFFVISDGPVSFGRFARFLRDGLDCPDALYFDGTISSLWAPGLGRMDRRTGLGTFVVVMAGPAKR
jgi:uncharacterized protein YigE (DUF2233 family)